MNMILFSYNVSHNWIQKEGANQRAEGLFVRSMSWVIIILCIVCFLLSLFTARQFSCPLLPTQSVMSKASYSMTTRLRFLLENRKLCCAASGFDMDVGNDVYSFNRRTECYLQWIPDTPVCRSRATQEHPCSRHKLPVLPELSRLHGSWHQCRNCRKHNDQR